jgi:8-hydroxy-5-deazaflavin:NADPH oxidoreductase
MSTISIIGVGTMARALAARALAGGNAVEVIGRDPAKTQKAVAALAGATAGEFGAVPAGDIVILAVPYSHAASVVGEYGDALAGKVVIDITNPVNADATGFVTPEGSSGAQEIARSAAPGVRVVKAFNTLFAAVLRPTRSPATRWTSSSPPMTTPPRTPSRSSSSPWGCDR